VEKNENKVGGDSGNVFEKDREYDVCRFKGKSVFLSSRESKLL